MSSRHDIKLTINDYLWTDTATDTKIPPRNFRIGRAEQSRAQEEYLRIFYSARNLIARIVYVDIRNVFFFPNTMYERPASSACRDGPPLRDFGHGCAKV